MKIEKFENLKNNKVRMIAIHGGHIMMAVIVVAILCFIVVTKRCKNTFTDLVDKSINNYVKYSAQSFSDALTSSVFSANFLSDMIIEENASEKDIVKGLSVIRNTAGCYQAMYVGTDKQAVDYNGEHHNLSGVEYSYIFETTETDFYYTTNDELHGDNVVEAIIACVPVVDDSECFRGYVIEYFSANVMDSHLATDYSYSYSFYTILDREDNVTMVMGGDSASDFIKGDLIENITANLDENDPSWEVLKSKFIRKGIQKTVHVRMGDDSRCIYYAPIEVADWNLVVFVRTNYRDYEVSKYTQPVNSMLKYFVACLVAILITYIVIMLFIFIQTKENNKKLENKAETDQLTGLNNKVSTEQKIASYIKENPNGQGVFFLVDVDNFKKVNDTMGHAFGDEVLRNLGLRLRALFRSSDIIGRIGGDEFVVFLKDVNDMAIIEREAKKLEDFFKDFKVGEYVKYTVTASLGAAIYSKDGTSFEELYKNSDKALYDAKHHGKKQLAFYDAKDKNWSN